MNKTTLMAAFVVAALFIAIFIKESTGGQNSAALKDDAVILAFGDSLTYGHGVSTKYSYPAQMQEKTGIKVINAGVSGELSSQGLSRLPALLKKYKPDLVILCHGGNDILKKRSLAQLKKNLLKMIKLIRQNGAKVLLVGVPDFDLFNFSTPDIYEEVANETGVLFEDDVLTYIELHRTLKSDYVHPNEKGYEMMADTFIDMLDLKSRF